MKQVSSESYISGEARVCVIGANRVGEMSLKKDVEVLSAREGNEGDESPTSQHSRLKWRP